MSKLNKKFIYEQKEWEDVSVEWEYSQKFRINSTSSQKIPSVFCDGCHKYSRLKTSDEKQNQDSWLMEKQLSSEKAEESANEDTKYSQSDSKKKKLVRKTMGDRR